MKSVFLLSITFFFLIVTVNAQSTNNIYIPNWEEDKGVEKSWYDENITTIKSSIDSLNMLQPQMVKYDIKRGLAMNAVLNSYINIKVSSDTIYHYANRSFKISPSNFCHYWDSYLRKFFVETKNISFYFKDEQPAMWDQQCEKCQLFLASQEVYKEKEKLKNTDYYLALQRIEKNDRLYRVNEHIDWDKQNVLDSMNRIALDSLYEEYGFPTKVALGGHKSLIAWLVLQHSVDCDFVKKWIERFLDARLNGEEIQGPLFGSFERFFNPKDGQCQDGEVFIKHLKTKYPKYFAVDFGYEKFYKE